MACTDLTTKNFNDTMDNRDLVIIDFWAEWCGPCKKFSPVFEKAAVENVDITFAKVNTDAQQAIAKYYGVYSVPTIIVVREGIIVKHHEGMLSEEAMARIITDVKKLDMDEIREALEREEDSDH